MSGGYYGGWDPTPFLNNPKLDFPTTHYKTAKGRDYMDFGEWAGKLGEKRDETLKGIYFSAKMMKFNPMITKDLKKTYSLVASAALKAMTPKGKWEAKVDMVPYNAVKKGMAKDVANYKAKLGYVARRGLAGRVAYWNKLRDMEMDDDDVPQMLSGVNYDIVSKRPEWQIEGPWAEDSYEAYKAALKAKMNAMRDKIYKMTPAEYLAYQTRNRALKDVRAAISKKRTALKEAWKGTKEMNYGKFDSALYDPGSAAILADTLKGNKIYSTITPEMLNPYLKSSTGMMDAYTRGIADWDSRKAPERASAYVSEKYAPLSLTSRGPADFKALAAANMEEDND